MPQPSPRTEEERTAKHEDEMLRGREAELLMNNPMLVEALSSIREGLEKVWRNSPIPDVEVREEAFRELKLLNLFETHLTKTMTTGKMAASEETLRQDLAQRSDAMREWDGSASTARPENLD